MLWVTDVMLNEAYEPLISFWSKSTMSAISCTGSPVTLGCVLHHFPEQLSVTELASAFLAHCGEDKSLFPEVERRIASVNGTMVIRANQYKISQLVFSPTTQPAHMVRLGKFGSILVA